MNFFKVPPTSISFLRNLVISNKIGSPLVSMAIGRVMAYATPLPPSKIDTPMVYYCENAEANHLNFLDAIHDVVPVNHKAILEYAKKFWHIRYDVALGGPAPSYTGSNGVYNLYHVGVYLTPDELGLLKDNSSSFGGLIAGFETIYCSACEIKSSGVSI